MPRKPTQSTQKSQKKKSKRSTQEPKFPLDFSDNTITAIIIPQVLPMLLNIPKNEITVDDFEKKLRFLIKTLLKNDLEDDIAGFDFEADRMPLDSLQNIIRAVKTELRKQFNVKLEFITRDRWCEFRDQPGVDEAYQGFLTCKLIAAEHMVHEATIKCCDSSKQNDFKVFKDNSPEAKFLKVVLSQLVNASDGTVKYTDLLSDLPQACKEFSTKNDKFTMPKNHETLLRDFMKYEFICYHDEESEKYVTLTRKFRKENDKIVRDLLDKEGDSDDNLMRLGQLLFVE